MTRVTIHTSRGAASTMPWSSLATATLQYQARDLANQWIKRLRHVPFGPENVTMRERFTYRGDSLWWFTELYLQKMRRMETALLAVTALDDLQARLAPTRVTCEGADPTTAVAARAWGAARGVVVETPGASTLSLAAERRRAAAVGWSAYARLWRRGARPAPAAIGAFVHTAFVRGGDTYIGPVLDALVAQAAPAAVHLVGVGPRRTYAARGATGASAAGTAALTPIEALAPPSQLRGALRLWRKRAVLGDDVTRGDAVRDAARVLNIDLWPVLEVDLRMAAEVQWPWSARAMDEAGAALDALGCGTAVTYAEAGGVGRALILEARRRGVRTVGLQHGFIYRQWLNYLHEADEWAPAGTDRGVPAPDQTLLYDHWAEGHLRNLGHFPGSRLTVTGSPRLDVLAARLTARTPRERAETRYAFGVTRSDQRLVLLTAKFSEVKDDLPSLVAAIGTMPDVHLVIKAHPAETADAYAPLVASTANITVAAPDADLAALLGSADAVVTKNSTVALDGLALGIPALVIGLPNNLTPFVTAGAMLGADGPDATQERLAAVLYDQKVRVGLTDATNVFLSAHGIRPRGTAAVDAAAAILDVKASD